MSGLVHYDQARTALEQASRVDEVKHIADQAAALKAYARQRNDQEMYRWVTEIQLRARRRIGELSMALEKGAGRPVRGEILPSRGKNFKSEALRDAGLSTSEAHRCEQVAAIPVARFETYVAQQAQAKRPVTVDDVIRVAGKTEKRAHRDRGGAGSTCTVADLEALVDRGVRFGTIYADPPWLYGNQSTRAATGNHYDGMTIDEICALPVGNLVAEDAHCHLWTTNAFLFDAKRVLEAWGFEYKSCFIWVKPQMGIGNYWRVSHEFMLFGIRGDAPFADRGLMSWLSSDRGRHSAKPEAVRQLVERASPGPRLELFGRRVAPGWTVWGNQIERTMFEQEVEHVA